MIKVAVSNWSSKKSVMKLLCFESHIYITFFGLLWKGPIFEPKKKSHNKQPYVHIKRPFLIRGPIYTALLLCSCTPALYIDIPRFFFWAGSVGTSLASHKFPPEHRLRLLLAGPFQLFFAFSTFVVLLAFSHFFRFCSLIFAVPSLFIREASRQQLIRIFPKYTADTRPCDGPPSRLYHF